jgi:hypothetical protein
MSNREGLQAHFVGGLRHPTSVGSVTYTWHLSAGLWNFYQAAMDAGEGGTAASARAELMQHILEVLTKG